MCEDSPLALKFPEEPEHNHTECKAAPLIPLSLFTSELLQDLSHWKPVTIAEWLTAAPPSSPSSASSCCAFLSDSSLSSSSPPSPASLRHSDEESAKKIRQKALQYYLKKRPGILRKRVYIEHCHVIRSFWACRKPRHRGRFVAGGTVRSAT